MRQLPNLPASNKTIIYTNEFLGLNRGLSIADGEMADMLNMSGDNYPVLSTRPLRGTPNYSVGDVMQTVYTGQIDGMLGTDHLTVCHDGKVYMDGREIPITLSTDGNKREKKLVSMGAYVCIWPDKKYFHVNNLDDYGDMGRSWSAASGTEITATMCRKDGTDYDTTNVPVSPTPPASPSDNDFWIDSSGEKDVLKQYSTMYQDWIQVATTYIKIQAPGIGKDLKASDVVWLSDSAPKSTSTGQQTLTFLPASPSISLTSSFRVELGSTDRTFHVSTPSEQITTQTIKVSGIPEGAIIKESYLTFNASQLQEGIPGGTSYAQVLTLNGRPFSENGSRNVHVPVIGNGSYNISFKFKTHVYSARAAGDFYDSIQISNIKLNVVYAMPESSQVSEHDKQEIDRLNTTNTLYGCGDDYIIVAGLLHKSVDMSDGLKLEMQVPDLDYVCEANNRIWGCVRSTQDGTVINEIRACALGDFRNWYRFEGASTDSYTVSVGSDGDFTGAYSMQGVPVFFKETFIHKISGTVPSNFTLNTVRGRGVQNGSWKSLAMVNETLFYKSRSDVMAYEGSMPYAVSSKLGNEYYTDAVGGSYRDKYYISMKDDSLAWHNYVLDVTKGMWHQEDMQRISNMANVGGELVLASEGSEGTSLHTVVSRLNVESPIDWMVTFGVMGFQSEQQKYLSRYNIRAQMSAGSYMKVEMQYDSDGKWVHMGTMKSPQLQTFLLPIIPRRCDHCQLRISGNGTINIYSVAREYENGGDG